MVPVKQNRDTTSGLINMLRSTEGPEAVQRGTICRTFRRGVWEIGPGEVEVDFEVAAWV